MGLRFIFCLFVFLPFTLFAQNDWDFVIRLNTNLEKANANFDRSSDGHIFHSSPGLPGGTYKVNNYRGNISNWGGLGMSANIAGELVDRFRLQLGIGFRYKVIRFDFYEDYKLLSPINNDDIPKQVEYHFDERYSQSIITFPITLSYEVIPEKLRIKSGIHIQTFFKGDMVLNNTKRAYNLEDDEDISFSPLFKEFLETDGLEGKGLVKALRHFVLGADWQFSEKMSANLLFRYGLKDIAIFEYGTVTGKLGLEFGLNYWMSFSDY